MIIRSSRPEVVVKKVLLKILQNSPENTCVELFKKSKFPVNFAESLKNSYFEEHLRTAASEACECKKSHFIHFLFGS